MRRFIIAPSMARLVRRERGSTRRIEGYFPTQSTRNSHVELEGEEGHLILMTHDEQGEVVEERTVVPRKPAEALLDVCAGRIEIERTVLAVSGRELRFERISGGGRSLDIASVDAGSDFIPPAWVGREVGNEDHFANRSLALDGIPIIDVPVSDAALNALIDTLDNRFGAMFDTGRSPPPARVAAAEPAPPRPQLESIAEQAPRKAANASARQEAPVHAQATVAREPSNRRSAEQGRGNQNEAAASAPAQPEQATNGETESTPAKRMETIIQGLSKVLREPAIPAEGEGVVEVDRWGGRRR